MTRQQKVDFARALVADNESLRSTLQRLVFAARTSGGIAGRDESLCKACDEAERLLVNSIEPTE